MFTNINFKTPFLMILGFLLTLTMAVNAPAETAGLGQRDLKIGKMGPDVIVLQKKLAREGFNPGTVDGIYAFKTAESVEKWQKSEGIAVTGAIDKKNAQRLMREPKSKTKNYKRVALSQNEVKMLAQAVHGEARGESLEGQVAVAAVIINRTRSNQFPKTIKGVVYEPWAFTAVHDGQFYMQADKRSYKAVELAVKGWDPTGGALYYYNPVTAESQWIWSRPVIKQIGKHVFAK